MKRILATAALLAATVAAPASAVTLIANFNEAGGTTVASVSRSNISLNLTVSGISFANVEPGALTNISANSATARNITTNNFTGPTARGLGISGGADNAQMDTNQVGRREAFLITGSNAFYLTGLVLNRVDPDDTLQIYGVNANGSLVSFAYGTGNNPLGNNLAADRAAGTIQGGAGGSLLNLSLAGGTQATASFNTGLVNTRFTRYLITTRLNGNVNYLGTGGQGFALSGLTATVPEPATWGLLLVGFGLVGVAARRRSHAVAA
jgi:hypothetical protein